MIVAATRQLVRLLTIPLRLCGLFSSSQWSPSPVTCQSYRPPPSSIQPPFISTAPMTNCQPSLRTTVHLQQRIRSKENQMAETFSSLEGVIFRAPQSPCQCNFGPSVQRRLPGCSLSGREPLSQSTWPCPHPVQILQMCCTWSLFMDVFRNVNLYYPVARILGSLQLCLCSPKLRQPSHHALVRWKEATRNAAPWTYHLLTPVISFSFVVLAIECHHAENCYFLHWGKHDSRDPVFLFPTCIMLCAIAVKICTCTATSFYTTSPFSISPCTPCTSCPCDAGALVLGLGRVLLSF